MAWGLLGLSIFCFSFSDHCVKVFSNAWMKNKNNLQVLDFTLIFFIHNVMKSNQCVNLWYSIMYVCYWCIQNNTYLWDIISRWILGQAKYILPLLFIMVRIHFKFQLAKNKLNFTKFICLNFFTKNSLPFIGKNPFQILFS